VTRETAEFGLAGERLAERWLEARGWCILARRYRAGRRDIDLIAERNGVVAFVEVKARRGGRFGDPVEAVNWKKRRALVRAASSWILSSGWRGKVYRFDVIGVRVSGGLVRIRHVENAFALPDSCR
jgi:putative endonuclease